MKFWVELVCPAGVSSSRAVVVTRTGAFLVFCPSEESPQTFIHSSTHFFSMCRRLGSSLHTIDPLRHFSFFLGLLSAGVAPLPPCSRKLLDETVKTFTVFPSCLYLLDDDLHYSCWHWRKLPGGSRRGFHVAVLRILVLFEGLPLSLFFLFFFFFVLPTRCLLDVSRLLGLTLRPSAPVCCCHWDSLTRGTLAFAQEAVRGPPYLSPRLVLHMTTCAR